MPESIAFPSLVKQLDIIQLGRARLFIAADEAWDSWFAGEGVTDDFMIEREQPGGQKECHQAALTPAKCV